MVFITDVAFIFMGKEITMNVQSLYGLFTQFSFIVRKDSYAAVLFVTTLNQFFLSFLVPVVIELGSESEMMLYT